MKEPLYIDCCTTKIKVISINGHLEQSKILLRANENSEQKQANCHRRKEMLSVISLRVVNHFTRLVTEFVWGFFTSPRGHLEEIFSGGSTKGAEHSNWKVQNNTQTKLIYDLVVNQFQV